MNPELRTLSNYTREFLDVLKEFSIDQITTLLFRYLHI